MLGVLIKKRVADRTVVDDRGRTLDVRGREGLDERLGRAGALDVFDVEVRRHLPRWVRLATIATLIAGIVMVAGVGVLIAASVAGWDAAMPTAGVVVVVSLAALIALGWMVLIGLGMHLGGARTRSLRAIGWCTACAYDLHDIPREPDGMVTCPECGGAWRFEPPHQEGDS